jgi:hypothetical protein
MKAFITYFIIQCCTNAIISQAVNPTSIIDVAPPATAPLAGADAPPAAMIGMPVGFLTAAVAIGALVFVVVVVVLSSLVGTAAVITGIWLGAGAITGAITGALVVLGSTGAAVVVVVALTAVGPATTGVAAGAVVVVLGYRIALSSGLKSTF